MDLTVATYVVYLVITVPLTIWVASTLSRNGKVFLADVFEDKEGLGEAVNHLLVVGFYLLNLGFVILYLRIGNPIESASGLFNTLSVKIGVVMVVLGCIHFCNILVFNSIRRRGHNERVRVAQPQQHVPPVPYASYGPVQG